MDDVPAGGHNLSDSSMGRILPVYLEGNKYICKYCHTHLALYHDLASKEFRCNHGRAYLFHRVLGTKEERMMLSGMNTVADIFCMGCGSLVGWRYEATQDIHQRYKVGKYILERVKVSGVDGSIHLGNQEDLMAERLKTMTIL